MRFLFGCETELNSNLAAGISRERYDCFDFIIIPTTHFCMKDYTLTTEQLESAETRAKACGCKFYLGSDAHHPIALDKAKAIFERAVDVLELT